MMSGSGGLKPRAVAGRPSVTRLTQRSWTGMRASGRPMAAVRKMLQRERRKLEEDNGRHFGYKSACWRAIRHLFSSC